MNSLQRKLMGIASVIKRWVKQQSDIVTASSLGRRTLLFSLVPVMVVVVVASIFLWYQKQDHLLTTLDAEFTGRYQLSQKYSTTELVTILQNDLRSDTNPASDLLGFRIVGYAPKNSAVSLSGDKATGGEYSELGTGKFHQSRSRRFFSISEHYDTRVILDGSDASGLGPRALHLRVDAKQLAPSMKSATAAILMSLLSLSFLFFTALWWFLSRTLLMPALSLGQQVKELNALSSLDNSSCESLDSESEFQDDGITGVRSVLENSLEQIKLEQSRNERLDGFIRMSTDLVWETDHRLRLTYLKSSLGVAAIDESIDELSGHSVVSLLVKAGYDESEVLDIYTEIRTNGVWEGKLPIEDGAEDSRSIMVVAEPLSGDSKNVTGYAGIAVDTSAQSNLAKQHEYQAHHDEMTGLINRRACDLQLQRIFAAYQDVPKPTSVCLLDLDQFKQVNDACGHAAGDLLLTQVAKLLTSAVRSTDLVARVGGDEFCIILENCGVQKAVHICEKVRGYIDNYRFNWQGKAYTVGVSIGIVELSDEFENVEEIVSAADSCCYRAKRNGKNQVQIHTSDDELMLQQKAELELISSIKLALSEDWLQLFYQPIKPVVPSGGSSDELNESPYIEVFSRIVRPSGEVEIPVDFMPIADRFNLMPDIDRHVCKKVFSLMQDHENGDTEFNPVRVSINLSRFSVVDRAFHSFLEQAVEESEFNPERLIFEVPENAFTLDLAVTRDFIDLVTDLGGSVAIDNFGCGALSVAQVHGLPVSCLKLDDTLTTGLGVNFLNEIVLRGIVDAAPMLGVELVAQRIEDERTERMLLPYGVHYLQGYHYSKPVALDDFSSIEALSPLAVDSVYKPGNDTQEAA